MTRLELITERAQNIRKADAAFYDAETLDAQKAVSYGEFDVAPEDYTAYSENQWQNIDAELMELGLNETERLEFYGTV